MFETDLYRNMQDKVLIKGVVDHRCGCDTCKSQVDRSCAEAALLVVDDILTKAKSELPEDEFAGFLTIRYLTEQRDKIAADINNYQED